MNSIRLLTALSIGLLASCGGGSGGGGGSSSFNLLFSAPTGSTGASVELGSLRFKTKGPGDVVLAPGVAVTGLIQDGAGAPMAGVNISFKGRANGSTAATATTNGSGVYTVNLGEGTWTATIDSADPAIGSLTEADIDVGAIGLTQNFQFPTNVVASGILFDSNMTGIDGAQVDFTGTVTGATATATADAFGFYSATLPPDTYEVIVDPGLNGPTQLMERFEAIQVAATGTIHFGLTEGVTVSGVLLNDIGGPLTEAVAIDVILDEDSEFFAPATAIASAADGTYSIGPVPPGDIDFRYSPPADSGYPRQIVELDIDGPMAQLEDVMLASGVQITGTVLWDDALTAADGCTIQAVTERNGVVMPEVAVTNGAGFYQLSLFPGDWNFQISPSDPADLQLPELRLVDVPNAGPMAVNVTLTRGVTLAGTVDDGTGDQPDILVAIEGVFGASSVTDVNGDYSFLAPAGTHELSLTGVDGFYEYVALEPLSGVAVAGPGAVTQDITLVRSTAGRLVLQGTVFEPDGTTAAAGSEVTARDNKTGAILARTIADAAGLYELVVPE